MKLNRLTLASLSLGLALNISAALPIVKVLGQDYYVYEVKKGDSVYGVAKKFGWDPNVLSSLNPEAVREMAKGERLYYPLETVPANAAKSGETPARAELPKDLEPIRHHVRRGETVYSISGQYGIPVETFYEIVPSSRKGLRAGETVVIDQNRLRKVLGNDTFIYTVKQGDTLFALARKYNTSVERLLKDNPGVSESNFQAGRLIKIVANSLVPVKREQKSTKTVVTQLDSYKVDKDDTWASVARKTGTTVEELRDANSTNTGKLKKDETLTIPRTETVETSVIVDGNDPREESSEGLAEIYDQIHKRDEAGQTKDVKVAMVVETPVAKRDVEFIRGYLYALDGLKDAGYKIGFKVVPSEGDTDRTIAEISGFSPDLLINTSEKGVPKWMSDYARENKSEIANVFDAKSDVYTQYPEVIQLLTPSGYFYDSVREYVEKKFDGRTLLLVGEPDKGDAIAQTIRADFPDSKVVSLSIEELRQYALDENSSYLVYSYSNAKDDVVLFLNALQEATTVSPLATVSVMGRPSWIVLGDQLASKFYAADVFFPSRFYFDTDAPGARRFIDGFTEFYGRGPLKSYPNYAATGYDIANYFIPGVAFNEGDFNVEIPDGEFVQSPLELERYSTWGGLFNTVCYIVRYTPYTTVEVDKI